VAQVLSASGLGAYDVTLAPGTYDVLYGGNPAGCSGGAAPPLPCAGGVVKAGVALAASGVLDLDLQPVKVCGTVTLRGAPLPATSTRGAVVFVATGAGGAGAVFSAPISAGQPTGYAVTLLPGTFDVRYSGSPDGCDATAAAPPCAGGTLKSAVTLSASGVLDLDIPEVRVSGKVTARGAALTDSSGGALVFAAQGATPMAQGAAAGGATTALGQDGTYAVFLMPGAYNVSFGGDPSGCELPSAQLPCTGGPLKPGLVLMADGVLDLDVPSVTVTGMVTLNGAAPPANAQRGAISFAPAGGAGGHAVVLPSSGAATYRVALFPGSYTIGYAGGGGAGCAGPMPCNSGPLKTQVSLSADGVLDLDVPAVKVSGAVTVNGAAIGPATSSRGAVAFALAGGGAASAPIPASGAAQYSLTLLAGSYDVSFAGNAALCAGTAQAPAPCNGGVVQKGLMLAADGVLDLDVPMVRVSGSVLLDGQALPVDAASQAAVSFAAKGGSSVVSRRFGQVGSATYQLSLVKGAYVVSYHADPIHCGGATGAPCADQIILGCP
jgi:hypothetical protein